MSRTSTSFYISHKHLCGVLYCTCNPICIPHVFIIFLVSCTSLNHHTAPCCIRPRKHVTITFMHTITTLHRQFIILVTCGHPHCSFVLYCMIPYHVVVEFILSYVDDWLKRYFLAPVISLYISKLGEGTVPIT